jgi:hypothetical protein
MDVMTGNKSLDIKIFGKMSDPEMYYISETL